MFRKYYYPELYVGMTEDLQNRLKEHNSGRLKFTPLNCHGGLNIVSNFQILLEVEFGKSI
jgi:predicted GIY-YIG superfamily endonuclease